MIVRRGLPCSVFPSILIFTIFLLAPGDSVPAGAGSSSIARSLPENIYRNAQEIQSGRASTNQGQRSKLVLEQAIFHGRTLAIPLRFSALPGETVGRIRAQIDLPDSPWKFRKVELLKNSRLKVTAREKKTGPQDAKAKNASHAIEVNFSAGSRDIPSGLIGYLLFAATDAQTPSPIAVSIAKLETLPPGPETAPEKPLPLPTELPGYNPAPACFFFSH